MARLQAHDLATALSTFDLIGNDRLDLRDQLGWFAQHLAADARKHIVEDSREAERYARLYPVVLSTMAELERNANPTLALEAMVTRLRRV
jgi:hypothetical protein